MTTPNTLEIGPRALVLAIIEMLKAHLASEVTAMETLMDLPAGTIKVPSVAQGYTASRHVGVIPAPSVRVFVDRSNLKDQPRFPGAGAAWAMTTVRARFRVMAEADTDVEQQGEILTEAAGRVVTKYFTAWWDTMRAVRCERSTEMRGASLRERNQSEGMTSFGQQDKNTDDEVDISFEIEHRTKYEVSYSKDLAP